MSKYIYHFVSNNDEVFRRYEVTIASDTQEEAEEILEDVMDIYKWKSIIQEDIYSLVYSPVAGIFPAGDVVNFKADEAEIMKSLKLNWRVIILSTDAARINKSGDAVSREGGYVASLRILKKPKPQKAKRPCCGCLCFFSGSGDERITLVAEYSEADCMLIDQKALDEIDEKRKYQSSVMKPF